MTTRRLPAEMLPKGGKPCKKCKRPTTHPTGVCTRHPRHDSKGRCLDPQAFGCPDEPH